MSRILWDWLTALGWACVGAVAMVVSFFVFIRLFDLLTPELKEIEELKKNNIAVGIFMAGLLIAFAIVVSTAIKLL